MASFSQWVHGARFKTLPAAAAPVLVGVGGAEWLGHFSWLRAGLALATALALQIGANYSNDYSDGIRGTDNETRVGPMRLTGSGAAKPGHVLAAALLSWLVAAVCGFVLIWISASWWLLVAGAAAFVAAWFYTGGKNPYGYRPGVAEVMVFVFFGLMAALGTTWTMAGQLHWRIVVGAVGVGLLSCALLLVNNLRDIETDTASGKRTLCVVLGDKKSRTLFEVYLTFACVCAFLASNNYVGWMAAACVMMLALAVNQPVRRGATGKALIVTLKRTGLLTLAYGFAVCCALSLNA